MTSADEELQAKLKALRDAYMVSLDVRLDEIDATLDRLLAVDGGNVEDLNILHALAHKLNIVDIITAGPQQFINQGDPRLLHIGRVSHIVDVSQIVLIGKP